MIRRLILCVAIFTVPAVGFADPDRASEARNAEAREVKADLSASSASLGQAIAAIGPALRALGGRLAEDRAAKVQAAKGAIAAAQAEATKAERALRRAVAAPGVKGAQVNAALADAGKLQGQLSGLQKDLESQDKLGNFEIQDLMSRFNQSETLASSVQKKQQDTAMSIIGNLR